MHNAEASIKDPGHLEKIQICDFFKTMPFGFFVEVEASDAELGSHTFLLEKLGWNGILVKSRADLCAEFRGKRPKSRVVHAVCAPSDSAVRASVQTNVAPSLTLDEIIGHAGSPQINLVSIHGNDAPMIALRGLDLSNLRPALLLIEDSLHSLEKHRLLRDHGYALARRTLSNNWYVPRKGPARETTLWERVELRRKLSLAFLLERARRR